MTVKEALIDNSISSSSCRISRLPKVLAFELEVRGHHADYIRNFAKVWIESDIPAQLEFLVSQHFAKYHPNIVEFFRSIQSDRVSLSWISEADQSLLDRKPWMKYAIGWDLFCKYAKQRRADHGLLMYSDFFQLPVWLGQKSPCSFSAIYFRPTFHYGSFPNSSQTWKQRFTAMRKKWLLHRFVANAQLKELYCLDPYAIPYIQKHFRTNAKISQLADSFMMPPFSADKAYPLREELGIEPGRRVFSLIGVLDARKGPKQLLESIAHIHPNVGRKISIVLLGYIPEESASEVESLARKMNGVSSVQVILRNQYIESAEIQSYFMLSDVILTTYQNHMGSSSALIRAALAKKPVLSSNYGLMGQFVRSRRLGVVVDSSSTQAIASGIERLAQADLSSLIDIEQADRLVAENSSEQLGRDLLRMLSHISPSCDRSMGERKR